MTVPTSNGHGPGASGSITRSPSFAPITPVVRERVGDVATRLSEVEKIIEDLNLQSATSTTRSPTMGDLQQEINLLKKDINETRLAQKKQIDNLRSDIKNDVKEQISKTMRTKIEKKIMESVQAQVKIEVGEWGRSDATKKFIENLKNMTEENDALFQEAQVKLDNSRSRHENSTLDEQADFETNLSKIKLPDGNFSKAFPRTIRELFLYDEHQLLQLFDDYGLRRLNTHLENLNRFLPFIGLRFSIPEQSLDFLGEPPAYPSPNILESPKEEKPIKDLPAPHPGPGGKKAEVMPEVIKPEPEKPPQESTPAINEPVQAQAQEKQPDEKRVEEKHEVQQDLPSGPKLAEIELEAVSRQPPTAPANPRPPQSSPTFPVRTITRSQPPQPSPPEKSSVTGWFKSLADF